MIFFVNLFTNSVYDLLKKKEKEKCGDTSLNA